MFDIYVIIDLCLQIMWEIFFISRKKFATLMTAQLKQGNRLLPTQTSIFSRRA